MSTTRSMFGFVDLTLILLGSVALIGQLEQRDAHAAVAIGPADPGAHRDVVAVPVSDVFLPGEARLSARGRAWIAGLAARAGGRALAIGVAMDTPGSGRLNGWEQAAARTAAILYALDAAGYPEGRIEPQLPRPRGAIANVTVSIGD